MTHNQRIKLWSAATLVVTFAATAAVLRLEGRVWFCKCWQPRLWISEANGPHTSQHLLDPYSLSHLQHGLLLFLGLVLVLPDRPRAASSASSPLCRATTTAARCAAASCGSGSPRLSSARGRCSRTAPS